jgi:flagellar biosynthesis protein FlhB
MAAENNITICSAPPLARAIYYHTDLGAEIPSGLYLAVARILAYVFQLKNAQGYAARSSGVPG